MGFPPKRFALFRPQHDYLPGTEMFRQVDVPALDKKLGATVAGEVDGGNGFPPSDHPGPSTHEQAIRREVTGLWEENLGLARRAMEVYGGRLSHCAVDVEIDRVHGEPQMVAANLRAIANGQRAELRNLRDQHQRASEDLAAFRKRERVERPAAPRKPMGFLVGLLAVGFVLELLVNLSIFAGGDAFGLAGALMKVIAIPALNLGVAFALTFLAVRHILRRSWLLKLFASVAAGVLLLWILGFNLVVAHWRDALDGAVSVDAARLALDHVLATPFSLRNLNSWALFAIGVCAAAFAVADAWLCRDPLPGFGRRQEHVDDWRARYEDARADGHDAIRDESEDQLQVLRDAMRRAENGAAERIDIVRSSQHLCEDIENYRRYLQAVVADLGNCYREANLRARKDGVSPVYFAEPLSADLQASTMIPLPDRGGAETSGVLREAYDTVAEAYRAGLDSLAPLDQSTTTSSSTEQA